MDSLSEASDHSSDLYQGRIDILTARKQSLGQGNVFTLVCHSVHRDGVGFKACITGHLTRR